MSLSLGEKIALKLQGLSPSRVQKALALARAGGIELSQRDITSHLLCGCEVEPVIESLILARREGLETSWQELCGVDLASHGQNFDVVSVVRASLQTQMLEFTTFSPDMNEPLAGICRDGARVQA